MLFYFTSRLVSSVAAFLYPGYASYKTLSQRPASEEELERWLMYWSVLGCIVGVEYVAEWLISWIPFYYALKTTFLLYLALPQTKGSSYLYINHLQPFFHTHETQIDAALASFKARVYAFIQDRMRALWGQVGAAMGQQPEAPGVSDINSSAPPSLGDPVSGPAQIISSLWRSYGPSLIASGAAFLRQSAGGPTPAPTTTSSLHSPPTSPPAAPPQPTQSLLERRRQLEAELAALDATIPQISMPVPMPGMPPSTSSVTSSRASSSSDVNLRSRERNLSSSKFEEIEMLSDVEGYDESNRDGGEVEYGTLRPGAQTRTSWFGWGGGGSKGGYERVKSE